MLHNSYRHMLSCAILVLASFLSGCAVNLPAVRDFSKTTIAATDTFDNISDDLPKSCIRRVELTYEGQKVVADEDKVEYSDKYKQALADCNKLLISLIGIVEANDVLQAYAEALGKLASDDVVTFTTELEALRSNLGQINISGNNPFTGPRVDAVLDLASFLLNAAANGYRQKELIETIQIGQKHIGPLIEGLSTVAGDYRLRILKLEKDKIRRYQVGLLDARDEADDESIINAIVEKLYVTQNMIETINEKDKAAADYQEILNKILATHTSLSKSTNELDSALLLALIQDYARQLKPLIINIRDAYSN